MIYLGYNPVHLHYLPELAVQLGRWRRHEMFHGTDPVSPKSPRQNPRYEHEHSDKILQRVWIARVSAWNRRRFSMRDSEPRPAYNFKPHYTLRLL